MGSVQSSEKSDKAKGSSNSTKNPEAPAGSSETSPASTPPKVNFKGVNSNGQPDHKIPVFFYFGLDKDHL